MGVTHLPAVYDGFLDHPVLHDFVEHPLYLFSGLVYYQPLLSPTTGSRFVPHGVRLLSLFTVMAPMAMLGFFIFAAPHLTYPYYAHVSRPFGPDPLADQKLAGILMWSTSMVLGVAWLVVAAANWFKAEEEHTRRSERAGAGLAPGSTRECGTGRADEGVVATGPPLPPGVLPGDRLLLRCRVVRADPGPGGTHDRLGVHVRVAGLRRPVRRDVVAHRHRARHPTPSPPSPARDRDIPEDDPGLRAWRAYLAEHEGDNTDRAPGSG